MDTRSIDNLLGQLRATSDAAAGKVSSVQPTGGADFGQALQNALQQVSAAQENAKEMAQNFTAGEENVNLQDVMVNLQKASISFQQMVQVRNKLVSAYENIMNMPV